MTNRIRESRLERDVVRRVSASGVDVLRHQGIWRENLARALLCVVALFSMVFGLAGCDRRPVTERNASEPGGTGAAPMEHSASSIPSVHLLVDASEAMLFGAASGGRWRPAASAAPLTQEGMKYGLYTLTRRLDDPVACVVEALASAPAVRSRPLEPAPAPPGGAAGCLGPTRPPPVPKSFKRSGPGSYAVR